MNPPNRFFRRPLPPRAVAWAGLAAACFLLALHARNFDFLNDDAFISFRYAENLVRHGELTYNPGERVEGYTNFLWTMIMAAVIAGGADPADWSKAIGVAFSMETLLAVLLFSLHPLPGFQGRPRAPAWAAIAPLLLAASAPFAAWSEGGLETALFTFLLTVAVLRQAVELEGPIRRPWSAVAAALAALTRPEGLLLFALLAVHRTAAVLRSRPSMRDIRPHLRWAGVFVAVFAPYWAWRWVYYGYALPNTFYAKAGPITWGPGPGYVGSFVAETHAWIALPLLVLSWRGSPHGGRRRSLAALIAGAWLAYVAAIGGDFMGLYRFLVPVMPLLALIAQEGLFTASRRAEDWWRDRREGALPPNAARVATACAVFGLLVAHGAHNWRLGDRALEIHDGDGIDSIGWLKQFVAQTTAIGRHLARAYPPTTRIATSAAGALAYYSRLHTLDLLGLNDVYVAHEAPVVGDRPGHRRIAPEEYVMSRRPDLLIGHPWISAEPPGVSASDLEHWRGRGYELRTVRVSGLHPPYWSYFEARSPER